LDLAACKHNQCDYFCFIQHKAKLFAKNYCMLTKNHAVVRFFDKQKCVLARRHSGFHLK